MIPAKFDKTIDSIFMPPEIPDIIPIWDMVENKWKSFRLSRIIEFRDSEEILDTDKTGHDVSSVLGKELDKMRNKTLKAYRERIQKQKEEAAKSKENLGG